VLGVPREILDGPGVVSSACAIAMAQGARRLYASDIAIALTGVAGPEPHGGKEPGTVVVALAADDVEHARAYVSRGERDRVRGWAEQAGLDLVRRYLEHRPLPASSIDI
jgi:nicotinamide-nucleotide amidase